MKGEHPLIVSASGIRGIVGHTMTPEVAARYGAELAMSKAAEHDLGMVVLRLGGGRVSVEDTIDPSVGLEGFISVGDRVEDGQPLCTIHAASEDDWQVAAAGVRQAVVVGQEPVAAQAVVHEVIFTDKKE